MSTNLAAYEDHLRAPRGRGALASGPHQGAAGGSACGDLLRVAVRVEGATVVEAGFDAHGCAAAEAAGSAVVELVQGAPLLQAARVSAEVVAEELGGLSPPRRHAAALAADALHRALGAAAAGGAARLDRREDRTLVAMSGGVDSAVAARLALEAGHEVVGVTVELWADAEGDGTRSCCSPQAVSGARALAHSMGLPHLTLDLRERFRREVVEDFVTEHAAGRTPNPCVRCNGLVRFDEMLRLSEALGARRLATGHYARIVHDPHGPLLEAAADAGKDQSYMLARLSPADLERLWFPLAERPKAEVRAHARRAELPVADKAESQDLCFLAGIGQPAFLRRHGGGAIEPASASGEIRSLDGRVLGRHGGQERFTVGQRRGIGVSGPDPLYVVAKDATRNRVTVGPRSALARTSVRVSDAVLRRPSGRIDSVKLRYRSRPVACRVVGDHAAGVHAELELALEAPAEGVAPGQTACLMEGARVLGAGVIEAGRDA
jgi:tRNA-specific 2-thiouridylase